MTEICFHCGRQTVNPSGDRCWACGKIRKPQTVWYAHGSLDGSDDPVYVVFESDMLDAQRGVVRGMFEPFAVGCGETEELARVDCLRVIAEYTAKIAG